MDITRPPVALCEGPQPLGDISSHHPQIVDNIAGGAITPSDAVWTILRLSSNLRSTTGSSPLPLFTHTTSNTQYVCKVHLPELLSADISGQPFSNTTQARRDACFRVCSQLHVQGLLGTRLFRPPTPMMVPRDEGSEQEGDSKYPRKAPLFWEHCISASTRILYPTLLRFDTEGVKAIETGAEVSAIFILTKQPLPALNSFNVYNWGHSLRLEASRAVLNQGAPFEVTTAQLGALHRYTLHACRSISNKRLVCDLDKMPYFLAPVVTPLVSVSDAVIGPLPVLHPAILWSQIDDVCTSPVVPLIFGDLDNAEGYVIQERTSEFSNRFFVKKVRKDLSPLSKPEPYTVSVVLMQRNTTTYP
jgi:endoribonuclease Dicer